MESTYEETAEMLQARLDAELQIYDVICEQKRVELIRAIGSGVQNHVEVIKENI